MSNQAPGFYGGFINSNSGALILRKLAEFVALETWMFAAVLAQEKQT
jgi:hypothetical protein